MIIGCVCPTYKRPKLLGRAIYCFLQQTYLDSYLVVLDDAGQYSNQEHERWKLLSTSKRFDSLGGKRQAGIEMLPKDCDAYMAWDDDDVYFPEAVASVANALQQSAWAQCRLVYETAGPSLLKTSRAFATSKKTGQELWGYGGSWGYRLDSLRKVGGYDDNPVRSSNDDIDLGNKFLAKFGPSADSTSDGRAWYWYNRDPGVRKISAEGLSFWQQRAELPTEKVSRLNVGWNGPNVYSYYVLPDVHERPF